MRIVFMIALMAVVFPAALQAKTVYKFIPAQSQLVVQVNLDNSDGFEAIRKDLIVSMNRQAGLNQDNGPFSDLDDLISKIIIVTPVLTVDETFIFLELKKNASEFCRKLEEKTGLKLVSVKGSGTGFPEKRFTVDEKTAFSITGLASPKRTFALGFLSEKAVVLAKDNLSGYRKFSSVGLSEQDRKKLKQPKALAAGYIEMTAAFLEDYPYLPPIRRGVFSLTVFKNGSLLIRADAVCADEKTAGQTLMQVQQYIMVGGIVLNQLDPELMQDWMASVRAGQSEKTVTVNGNFTKNFISRLAASSEKLAGTLNQPEASGKGKTR